jgi:predicted RNase H-like nuclease (RuvC/YqgF family)
VFPLVGLDTERYDRLDDVIATLEGNDLDVAVRSVPVEFQQGATEMLVVGV